MSKLHVNSSDRTVACNTHRAQTIVVAELSIHTKYTQMIFNKQAYIKNNKAHHVSAVHAVTLMNYKCCYFSSLFLSQTDSA